MSLSVMGLRLVSPLLRVTPHWGSKRPLISGVTAGLHQLLHQRSRSYSTATVGIEDAQTLVEREHFARVRKQLETDPRKKITFKEFEQICANEGLTKDQAKQLSQSLSDAGTILYFANTNNVNLRDHVFLKPTEFNKAVGRILAELSDDTYLQKQVETKKSELGQLKAELHPLEDKLESFKQRAARRATTIMWAGFGYCLIQGAIVARLTWWELSWDVMEPVTYMLTFAVVLLGYSYFVLTGSEYTFEGLRKTLERRKLEKLIRKSGFDMATLTKLREAVGIREEEILKILTDIKTDPISLHLKDPSKPVV